MIVISSVTFTFISYWRTAAVVLCDLASTAYYIGAIVENAIGKAAPWFIVGVLLFSYGDARRLHRKQCRSSSAAAFIASSRRRWGASSPSFRSRPCCSTTS